MILRPQKEEVEYFMSLKPLFLHVRSTILGTRLQEKVQEEVGFQFRTNEITPNPQIIYQTSLVTGSEAYQRNESIVEKLSRIHSSLQHKHPVVKPKGNLNNRLYIEYFDPNIIPLDDLTRHDIAKGAFAYGLAMIKKRKLGVSSKQFIGNECQRAGLHRELEIFKQYIANSQSK